MRKKRGGSSVSPSMEEVTVVVRADVEQAVRDLRSVPVRVNFWFYLIGYWVGVVVGLAFGAVIGYAIWGA